MFARPPCLTPQTFTRGSALLMAIVVLVIGGLLGAAMVRLLRSGSMQQALEVVSTRALHAAESGAQRKANEILFSIGAAACVATDSWTLPASTMLEGCQVTIACRSFVARGGELFYTIDSTGQCGSAEYVAQRTVEVQIMN